MPSQGSPAAVAGEVDGQGCLARAAVAVEHDVPSLGDEDVLRVAQERVRALLLDGDELVERDGLEPRRGGVGMRQGLQRSPHLRV